MNILFVVMDTARGDITNSMIAGGELNTLSSLADNGQFYRNAHANGPWTVPSHAAMFSGEYPTSMGVTGDSPTYNRIPLIDDLSEFGFETACFSANPWLSPEFGFDTSFDYFYNKYDYYQDGFSMADIATSGKSITKILTDFSNGLKKNSVHKTLANFGFWIYQRLQREDTGGSHLLSRTEQWINDGKNRFAFVNITEPHLSYKLPADFLPAHVDGSQLKRIQQDTVAHNAGCSRISKSDCTLLRQVYQATLRYVDSLLGRTIEGLNDDTVVIVTGDHGEHFGEHGRFGHQYSLYQELLHVPLVVSGGRVEKETIDDLVELRNLYQLILEISNKSVDRLPSKNYHIAETVSPTPPINDLREQEGSNVPAYVEQYADGARCIMDNKMKLVEFADRSLTVVETVDCIEPDANRIDALHERLITECGEISYDSHSKLDVSDSVESRLDDLGYV